MSRATLERISSEPNTDVIAKAMHRIHGSSSDEISRAMAGLVKPGPHADDDAYLAEHLFRKAIRDGLGNPQSVLKSVSPQFAGALNMAMANSPQMYAMNQFVSQLNQQLSAELGKNISLTSPNNTGLVPFDLDGVLAP